MAANVSAWFDTSVATIEPNQEWSKQYTLFAGPKDPQVLDKYGLGSLLEYGWFGWVAKPLTLLLHTFYAVARNYGIAIVMLTVLVRSIMFPFSRRAAINAQKMQEVAPELKRINELYKDDWEKRTKATQEVYKKAKFNPMAGCMPLFIQLPIFIGLYRAVSLDIDLRQQPLIPGIDWCSNLAGPDMLLEWSSWMPDFIAGKGTGWFGPYLNLLPIFTITLFIIQQKVLMPKATDEQQQMTQTMMMYMTVFMGVLFFKVPAGLCIYFITSSTWSLVERQLVKRMLPKTTPNLAMAGTVPPKGLWSTSLHQKPRPPISLSKAPKVQFRPLDRNVPRNSRMSFHGSVGSKEKPRRTERRSQALFRSIQSQEAQELMRPGPIGLEDFFPRTRTIFKLARPLARIGPRFCIVPIRPRQELDGQRRLCPSSMPFDAQFTHRSHWVFELEGDRDEAFNLAHALCVHFGRTLGGDCHHRHFGGTFAPCRTASPRSSSPHAMHQQPQTNGLSHAQLRKQLQDLSDGQYRSARRYLDARRWLDVARQNLADAGANCTLQSGKSRDGNRCRYFHLTRTGPCRTYDSFIGFPMPLASRWWNSEPIQGRLPVEHLQRGKRNHFVQQ